MKVKNIVVEDFINYRKPSMFICTCTCTFKCCKEAGVSIDICQNSPTYKAETVDIPDDKIVSLYKYNHITKAIVFGGLEPLDQFDEVFNLIRELRDTTNDDIVIYTGYNKDEIEDKINLLKLFDNIIIKYGRYVPNDVSRFDNVLGVILASSNQYAEKIS